MTYMFLWIALAIALLDWIAVEKNIKPLEYFAKPATMIAALIWFWQNGSFQGPLLWFALGAIFSLAGDVFLMLPQNLFLAGLFSFLTGHLCYVIGFNQPLPAFSLIALLAALVLALIGLWLYRRLAAGLEAGGQTRLKMPVLIYSAVISLMVISALSRIGRWEILPALVSSLGAGLFYFSDATLAWDRFLAPLPHARLRTMVTYHLGQFAILLGAAWQWTIGMN